MSEPPSPDEKRRSRVVVGIGASAGGLEALEKFFSQVPADSGLSYVVVQHLSPEHASLLAELLGRCTLLTVLAVKNDAPAAADHVHVIAPGTLLEISGGCFRVKAAGAERRGPIDTFFKSLASDQGERAVGIVLSGSGTDGTSGLRAIKQGGGLTLAQAPETARHDSMPRSAIAAGVVDHVLRPEEMSPKLLTHSDAVGKRRGAGAPVLAVSTRRAVPAPWEAALPSDEQIVARLDQICEVIQH